MLIGLPLHVSTLTRPSSRDLSSWRQFSNHLIIFIALLWTCPNSFSWGGPPVVIVLRCRPKPCSPSGKLLHWRHRASTWCHSICVATPHLVQFHYVKIQVELKINFTRRFTMRELLENYSITFKILFIFQNLCVHKFLESIYHVRGSDIHLFIYSFILAFIQEHVSNVHYVLIVTGGYKNKYLISLILLSCLEEWIAQRDSM